jgi:hypothetical protein
MPAQRKANEYIRQELARSDATRRQASRFASRDSAARVNANGEPFVITWPGAHLAAAVASTL